MPIVYVAGNLDVEVELGSDDDFAYEQWTDESLKKQRQEYKRPNISLWLEAPNPEDAISPYAIPVTELDMYEGVLSVSQKSRIFTLSFKGAAKVNAHKDVKSCVDSGGAFKLVGVSVNGQQVEMIVVTRD